MRYSISSPNFGFLLLTTFVAAISPFLLCGVITTFDSTGSFFGSFAIALFTIASPTFAESFTFTLKTILLFSVSVISGYFAITFPSSTFSSTGSGFIPSAFRLSFTYSTPLGSVSSTSTFSSFPFSTEL
ncbi:Uncharacterised protein [Streptococcus pneumoniae]|nr:Uncharacterised protein [Streptococcus pneumoniae]CJD23735.1 Uncharacterised protein [Streptococcus pneumoniae]